MQELKGEPDRFLHAGCVVGESCSVRHTLLIPGVWLFAPIALFFVSIYFVIPC